MHEKIINVKVFRYDPSKDKESYYQDYQVSVTKGMSAIDVLDYIYENLDSTLAYYDHAACSLGICVRCTGKINGKAGLFCQTAVEGDVTLGPTSESKVLKDLVIKRKKRSNV
jgi:succinate dehydrogenase/fumarate reductase-like Fe-S protein